MKKTVQSAIQHTENLIVVSLEFPVFVENDFNVVCQLNLITGKFPVYLFDTESVVIVFKITFNVFRKESKSQAVDIVFYFFLPPICGNTRKNFQYVKIK